MKGYVFGMIEGKAVYYLINYQDGLVRRGLIGAISSLFVDQSDYAATSHFGSVAYTAAHILFLATVCAWALRVEVRRRDGLVASLLALFAASQFIPTTAYDAGFLDIYDYLLLLAAVFFLAKNLLPLVFAVGIIGPFIHEGFIFVWFTLATLALHERFSAKRTLALLAPLISTAIVYFAPSEHAALLQMSHAPLPDLIKHQTLLYDFGQSFPWSVWILLWKIGHNVTNFLLSTLFFTCPATLILVTYGAHIRRRKDIVALAVATALPMSINFVAWDLSRFLVSSAFFAFLSVIYMETTRPTARARWFAPALCWAAAGLLIQLPLIYAFYELAFTTTYMPQLTSRIVGAAVDSLVGYYNRYSTPIETRDVGTEEAPGNVWYMEDGSFVGTLTRRPGTNLFDASLVMSEDAITYVARITRKGDRIFITRNPFDPDHAIIYSGELRDTKIHGQRAGGRWYARILR